MDELQTIREALEYAKPCVLESGIYEAAGKIDSALASLSRLEARAAEILDAKEIVAHIRRAVNPEYKGIPLSTSKCAAEIGQYAYRYAEDIRKDRDYWKDTATAFRDAIHQHIENHKGEAIKSECVGCEGQGLDCAESCLRPKQ